MTVTDDATHQWTELAEHMEALLTAWDTGEQPPNVGDFLPQGDEALRLVGLVELIKIDLEQRKSHNLWQPLEWYAEKFPEMLQDGEPPCDLIYEEYHVRKAAQEKVDPQEYFRRFPKSKAALARLLNCNELQTTTSLAAGRPKESFQPGDSVDDFDLLTRLGTGAFASVFLARQRSMQRLVALKISADKGTEPQTLANLDHPHIVRVYDQRRLDKSKLRLLYMQYAPGGTLQEVVQRVRRTVPNERSGKLLIDAVNEALDHAGYGAPELTNHRHRLAHAGWPETVCRIGIQLAQALDYAHHHGVLHRDVKPANVLLTAECTPKLADFNISFSSQIDGATPAAYFGGSLAYMSPEQLEACNPEHERSPESLDGRADLYSLAAMLWELLYGERPFREEGLTGSWTATLTELTRRRRTETPKPPANAPHDEITQALTDVLRRMLAPDSEQRPADGEAFARELAMCLQPRARKLLALPHGGVRQLVRSWPLLSAIAVILIPNGFAGAFNFFYNGRVIVQPGDYPTFVVVSTILNVIYFSLGAFLIFRIVGPPATSVCQPALTSEEAVTARRKLLTLGHVAAGLGLVLWLSSGIVFPATLFFIGVKVEGEDWVHFFVSMMICGLVAAAYPFFGLTYLVTHIFFPVLLSRAPGDDEDESRLTALARQAKRYFPLAGFVPMLGIFLIVLSGAQQKAQLLLILLILIGGLGIWLAYWLWQRIVDDIDALLVAVRPIESEGTLTASVGRS
jgi:serine/threonine protein kinase